MISGQKQLRPTAVVEALALCELGALCYGLLLAYLSMPKRKMRPRVSVITIGVSDLERAVSFYRDGLGLSTEGIVGQEFDFGAVAFFQLQPGLRLALWPRASIAQDTGLDVDASSATEFTIGHNVASKSEVDVVMEQARAAGAAIVKPASDTFWGGYAGYFQDPDDHLWEVVWNPEFMPLD